MSQGVYSTFAPSAATGIDEEMRRLRRFNLKRNLGLGLGLGSLGREVKREEGRGERVANMSEERKRRRWIWNCEGEKSRWVFIVLPGLWLVRRASLKPK